MSRELASQALRSTLSALTTQQQEAFGYPPLHAGGYTTLGRISVITHSR